MNRRDLLFLGSVAIAWPLTARSLCAQQKAMPVIGYLGLTTESASSERIAGFVQRLRDLGWIEGRSVTITYRWADGRSERLAEAATELIRLKVDVIVTSGTEAVVVAMRATSVIPIVFTSAGDPVGNKLVASLARPGGNVTGLSIQATDLAGKRLELMREAVPGLRRLAILANVDNPAFARETTAVRAEAHTLGLVEVPTFEIRRAEDIAPAFEALKDRADALYVYSESLVVANRGRVAALALEARLSTMFGDRMNVEAGGLMSYGGDLTSQFRRTADYVDKILRGTKPSEIPIEQPTKFELVINLKTAKALGLTVPQSILTRADEVIE